MWQISATCWCSSEHWQRSIFLVFVAYTVSRRKGACLEACGQDRIIDCLSLKTWIGPRHRSDCSESSIDSDFQGPLILVSCTCRLSYHHYMRLGNSERMWCSSLCTFYRSNGTFMGCCKHSAKALLVRIQRVMSPKSHLPLQLLYCWRSDEHSAL